MTRKSLEAKVPIWVSLLPLLQKELVKNETGPVCWLLEVKFFSTNPRGRQKYNLFSSFSLSPTPNKTDRFSCNSRWKNPISWLVKEKNKNISTAGSITEVKSKDSKLTAHSSVDLETHLGESSELQEHDLPRRARFQKCSNSAYTILNSTPKRQERQCWCGFFFQP